MLNQELCAAIRNHDDSKIALLASPNNVNDKSETLSIYNGDKELATGSTYLHIAVIEENSDAVAILLAKGANVNAQNDNKKTPLHLAVNNNDFDIATILVNNNADVKLKDKGYHTPFSCALSTSNIEIMDLLLLHGADINGKIKGLTPLHHAVAKAIMTKENRDYAIVEHLIAKNAHLDIQDNNGQTPLHFAAASPGDESRCAKILIDNGADVSLKNTLDGSMALDVAAFWGKTDVVSMIEERMSSAEKRESQTKSEEGRISYVEKEEQRKENRSSLQKGGKR